jgi:hypothetical protein
LLRSIFLIDSADSDLDPSVIFYNAIGHHLNVVCAVMVAAQQVGQRPQVSSEVVGVLGHFFEEGLGVSS